MSDHDRPSLEELRRMSVPELRGYAKASQDYVGACPHCEQEMWRLYRRSLNRGMVDFLVGLAELTHKGGWVHFSEVGFSSRDYPYLSWWRLAETMRSEDEEKSWAGCWRVTNLGLRFVLDHTVTVPSHMFHVSKVDRKKAIVGWETSRINITQVQKFNFMELMSGGSVPTLYEMYKEQRRRSAGGVKKKRRRVKRYQFPLFTRP